MTGRPQPDDGLAPSVRARRAADERRIGRLLITITYVAVAVLLIGVLVMLAGGISPLDGAPTLQPGSVLDALVALRPEAILLVGIGLVIATPVLRVIAAAATYARSGEVRMVAVSVGILVVIAVGVVSAVAGDPG